MTWHVEPDQHVLTNGVPTFHAVDPDHNAIATFLHEQDAAEYCAWKMSQAPEVRESIRKALLENDPNDLIVHAIGLECQVRAERDLADRWRKLAGSYDDIRGWLRLCDDDPAGHAEFYEWAALLIFGEYRNKSMVNGEIIETEEDDDACPAG
jgi:hypothetical protein